MPINYKRDCIVYFLFCPCVCQWQLINDEFIIITVLLLFINNLFFSKCVVGGLNMNVTRITTNNLLVLQPTWPCSDSFVIVLFMDEYMSPPFAVCNAD